MKKKFLSFLFAVCLILPCAFIMTACGDNPPPDDNPPAGSTGSLIMEVIPQQDIWLLRADANHYLEDGAEMIEDGNYSIWFADYYDKDTLEVLYDGETISTLTLLETPGYEDKVFGLNVRKIATFSLPEFDPGDHNLTIDVKEEELNIKFVSDGQVFSEDELEVLSDWYFPNNNDRDFASVIDDEEFVIKTTYNNIKGGLGENNGIVYDCKKPMGYYDEYAIFKAVNPNYATGNIAKENPTDYSQKLIIDAQPNDFTFDTRDIELTFYKERLGLANLFVGGDNADKKIFSYYKDDVSMGDPGSCEYFLPTRQFDLNVYIEEYPNVDLSNIEVYIHDTKMEIKTDPNKGNQKYFTIPAGKMPIDYAIDRCLHTYDVKNFYVDIRNVDVSNANFITTFNVTTNNNIETSASGPIYFFKDGASYYIPNRGVVASFGFSSGEASCRPTSVKFNGTTFNLSSYVYKSTSVPVWDWTGDEPNAYKDSTDRFYYYHTTIGGKPVEITVAFNDYGEISNFGLHFTLTESTNIKFIF